VNPRHTELEQEFREVLDGFVVAWNKRPLKDRMDRAKVTRELTHGLGLLLGNAGDGKRKARPIAKVIDEILWQLEVIGTLDILEVDNIWMAELAERGWIMPLGRYYDRLEQTFGVVRQSCKYRRVFAVDENGSGGPRKAHAVTERRAAETECLYALPYYPDVGLLMYRTSLTADDGAGQRHTLRGVVARKARTWEQLIDEVRRVKQEVKEANLDITVHGLIFQGKAYEGLVCFFYEMLWARGADILVQDGKPVFFSRDSRISTEDCIDTLVFMHNLIHEWEITPKAVLDLDEEDSFSYFMSPTNYCLVLRTWPYFFNKIQTNNEFFSEKGKIDVFPRPLHHEEASEKAGKMVLGGWNLALARQCAHRYKAWGLIDYLTSQKTLQDREYIFETEDGCIQIRAPANRQVLRDIRGDGDAFDYCFRYLDGRNYRTRSKLWYYSDYSKVLARHIHAFLGEEVSPPDVRRRAVEVAGAIQREIDQLDRRLRAPRGRRKVAAR